MQGFRNAAEQHKEVIMKPIWEWTTEASTDKIVNIVGKMEENPVIKEEKVRKAGNSLYVFKKEDLKDYNMVNEPNMAGLFYIISGYVTDVKEYKTSADITIAQGNEELTVCMNQKDKFYEKINDFKPNLRITALMCNNYLVDLKLGPIFGQTKWSFHLREKDSRMITDFVVLPPQR